MDLKVCDQKHTILSVHAVDTVLSAATVFAQSAKRTWSFDPDVVVKLPASAISASTGRGPIGQWLVMKDAPAPSRPNVLAQASTDEKDYRFPVAIVEHATYVVRTKRPGGTDSWGGPQDVCWSF